MMMMMQSTSSRPLPAHLLPIIHLQDLGMSPEEQLEFHDLWLTELKVESPIEHGVVVDMLAKGHTLLEAMRQVYAKRGGAAVKAAVNYARSLAPGQLAGPRAAAAAAASALPAGAPKPKGVYAKPAAKAARLAGFKPKEATRIGVSVALSAGGAAGGARRRSKSCHDRL